MINCSKEEIEQMIEIILASEDFKKLKDKTQNFPDPKHPEVSTRQDHTLDVVANALKIANAISDEEKIRVALMRKGKPMSEQENALLKKLRNINRDRVRLIAFCHDIGHTPFGHHAEHFFDRLLKLYGSDFTHYQHSTRVVRSIFEKNGILMPDGLGASIEAHSSTSQSDEIKRTNNIEPHIVRRSDKITYMIQDWDDMKRLGLVTEDDAKRLKEEYISTAEVCAQEIGLNHEETQKIKKDWEKQFDEFYKLSLDEKKKYVIDDIGTTTISNYINGKEIISSGLKMKMLLEEMNRATVRVITRDEAKHEDKANVILLRLWWEIYNNREEYEKETSRWKDYKWEEQCVYYLCEKGIHEIEKMYYDLGDQRALDNLEYKEFVGKLFDRKDDPVIWKYAGGVQEKPVKEGDNLIMKKYESKGKVMGYGYKIPIIQNDAKRAKSIKELQKGSKDLDK